MTFDPTTNRVQWYLLTDEERTALEEWPHGWESAHIDGWAEAPQPDWFWNGVYRAKPAPAVTSTWQNIYSGYRISAEYSSRALADNNALSDRIAVLRRDTINGVTTAHLEDV